MQDETKICDLFIIGGGINGCGIARDAAGRGLSVSLAEMGDLASATSSASTKLFHGGLRYLEYFKFRLVREALIERENLLRAMPHISWPMRFILPLSPGMRFESGTPAARLLSTVMPWMRGKRPDWMIRLGLFLYDHLGGRKILPGTTTLRLEDGPEGTPLKPHLAKAFEYSDCWVEDSRLVVLNARDALTRGAEILTRHRVISARREDGNWSVEVEDQNSGVRITRRAKVLVNAAGPWGGDVIRNVAHVQSRENVRLVRGSHIVTQKLFDHDKCYFFQGSDGRIVFAIPYQEDFTLIGTTDVDHPDPSQRPECTVEEQDYLCAFVSEYLAKPVAREDIVWTYSGVRPLYDDGASQASAATRDYVLTVHDEGGIPLLNIFGGKITTYRRLAESALAKVSPYFQNLNGDWTAGVSLPGGDFAVDGAKELTSQLLASHPDLSAAQARRLIRAYGTEAAEVMQGDTGRDFGAGLMECEVRWLMDLEFAQSAEDVVWRRSKLGLRLDKEQIAALDEWMKNRANGDDQRT